MEEKPNATAAHECPFCNLWLAMKKSDMTKHVQGVAKESLLLTRSIITACLRSVEDCAGHAADNMAHRDPTARAEQK